MGLRVGDEPVPNYRLVRFLGRGGFGQVWAAASPGGIHVALKIIDLSGREGVKEFKALRLMKSIRQANLTPILAFWLKDEDGQLVDESHVGNDLSTSAQPANVRGTVLMNSLGQMRPDELIIAMGLGDKTLSDRLRECQAQGLAGIAPEELFNYMIDAARAIDFLNTPRHDLGHGPVSPIQHCDIKPQNILIVGDTAQVCDFGLARELGTNVKMTSAAVSPAYGAPELIEGRPPSAGTDQYSLAISYVELRTGGLPFADPDSYLHVVNAHLQGGLDLSGLSPAEQDVIRKATSRDPADRYESAMKMIKALRQACPDDESSIRVMPSPSQTGTAAQSGSELQATANFSVPGMGHSTMPFPFMPPTSSGLTETPGARVGRTKVDSRLAATTAQLAEELEGERRGSTVGQGRIWKITAALALLGVLVGAAYYLLRPISAEDAARLKALELINEGRDETDLLKRAGLFLKAFENCQAFATDERVAKTLESTKDLLKQTWSQVEQAGKAAVGAPLEGSPPFEKLLAGVAYYDPYRRDFKDTYGFNVVETARTDLARQAAAQLVAKGEKVLEAPQLDDASLTRASTDFNSVNDLLQNDRDELQFRAKLGIARVHARRGSYSLATADELYGSLNVLGAEGIKNPLWEAQVQVLRALGARANGAHDVSQVLKALQELLGGGMRLLKSPGAGGAEGAQIDDLLAWAAGVPSLSEKDQELLRELEAVGVTQSLGDANSKLQAVLASNDETARQTALSALREAARRGIASNDPQTRLAFEELRGLGEVLDPQASKGDVDAAITWFASTPTEKQRSVSQWVTALAALAKRQHDQLTPVITALEAHSGDANALDKLPALYQLRVAQLVTEPAEDKDYFAVLAAACERLQQLGGGDRLSNLAWAESLHALHAGKPTRAGQSETIRGLLKGADRQPTVADQEMYEKFVRILVSDKPLSEAERSDLQVSLKFAKQTPPGLGFAVNARREELAQLLIEAARSVRAGINGPMNIEAVARPYGEGDALSRQAFAFLEGVRSLVSGPTHDPHFQANTLLARWYMGEDGKKVVLDRGRHLLKELARNRDLRESDRLPLLYLRVQIPADPDDGADRSDAIAAMSDLFEGLGQAEVAFDDPRVLELAAKAQQWVKAGQDPRPSDVVLKKELARLAYVTERLLLRYESGASDLRKQKRYEAYSLAVELDQENVDYLAARGFAGLDFDPPLDQQALNDAKQLQRLAPDSAAAQGLMAYVKLAQSRRETDAGLRAELISAAVKAGEAAVAATTDANDLATYLLHLGDSYVALANYGPKDPLIQAAHLRDAIDRVTKAKQLPGLVYEDYANIILGNAYEDLAWWAKIGSEQDIDQNYERAIAAFKEVSKSNPALGKMNLGRCFYKREVDSRQLGKGYLSEAKAALEEAVKLREGYADALRWLGAVYEAQGNLELALANYGQAAQLARQQKSYNYSYYIRHWARVASNSKQPPGPLRAQLLELAKDPQLQTPEAHRDLALRIGLTYEQEGKWTEAIDQYSKAMGPNPTTLDIDLLRHRGIAWAQQASAAGQKKEQILEGYRECARDWEQVVALSGDDATWFDQYQRAVAQQMHWLAARPGNVSTFEALKKSVTAYDAAISNFEKLTKQVPEEKARDAQAVFVQYVNLLKSDAFRTDIKQLTAVERKLLKEAPGRLSKAAGKVSNPFQARVIRDLLTPDLRQWIDKVERP